jgi:hypothetical protein
VPLGCRETRIGSGIGTRRRAGSRGSLVLPFCRLGWMDRVGWGGVGSVIAGRSSSRWGWDQFEFAAAESGR